MKEPSMFPSPAARTTAHVLAAVRPAGTMTRGPLYRSGWLTPYTAQTIADDALRAGPGAHLDVAVAPATDDLELDLVREELGWLAGRGIHVRIHRAALG